MDLIYKLSFKVWFDKEYPRDSDGKHGFVDGCEYEYWKNQLFEAYVAGAKFERVSIEAGM